MEIINFKNKIENVHDGENWFVENIDQKNNWTIISNLEIKQNKKYSTKEGEIDFLVMIPQVGMTIIEIKSHKNLELKNNQFYENGVILKTQPIEQSEKQRHSLMDYLKSNLPANLGDVSKIGCARIVLLPFSELFFSESVSFRKSEIIDKYKLSENNLNSLIENSIKEHFSNYQSSPSFFSEKNIDSISKSLMSNSYSPQEIDYDYLNKDLSKFDDYQKGIIDSHENSQNVIFRGYPGTGKTNILVYLAKKWAKQNKKILYLTFNRNLAAKLDVFDMSEKNIYVEPLFDFMEKIINDNSALGIEINNEVYEGPLQEKAIEVLESINLEEKDLIFDHVFIDEGQDLLDRQGEYNLLFVDKILRNGFENGWWAIATDFETQNIYGTNDEKKDPIQYLRDISKKDLSQLVTLKRNYRNTQSNGDKIFEFLDEKSFFDVYIRKNKLLPEFIKCDSDESEINELSMLIKKLTVDQKIPAKEIVLLSPFKAKNLSNIKGYEFVEVNSDFFYERKYKENKIRYSTIHSYKGLESFYVILHGFGSEFLSNSENIEDLFTEQNIRNLAGYAEKEYAYRNGEELLPKDDRDLLWKCQAYVKRGQEFTDEQISELERMFKLGLKSGFEPFNKYSRKLFHTGAWRSLLGLYVIYSNKS